MSLYVVKNDAGEYLSNNVDRLSTENEYKAWIDDLWYARMLEDKQTADQNVSMYGGHVVELVEKPAKVKLPKDVGEELDHYKQDGNGTYDLAFDIADYNENIEKIYDFAPEDANNRDELLDQVMDALRYGWEAKQEPMWYVQTPQSWWKVSDYPEYFVVDDGGEIVMSFLSEATAFTAAELHEYGLDADVFKKIPLKNKEVQA